MPWKDPEKHNQYIRDRRKVMRKFIDDAKNKPCLDCGKSFSIVSMQFDHVRGEKKFRLAEATAKLKSLEVVQEEIDKCEVVCANCHLVRTDNRLEGQWKPNR